MPPKKANAALPAKRRGKAVPQGVRFKRHRKLLKDNINGITKPAIRRLARRGGVKRIQVSIYDEIRTVIKQRLSHVLSQITDIVTLCDRKTVTVSDVIFVLRRIGTPVYGFDNQQVSRRKATLADRY